MIEFLRMNKELIFSFAAAITAAIIIPSCSSSTSSVDGVIDASQKTISITTGRGGILTPLKAGLRQRGWIIVSRSLSVRVDKGDGQSVSHPGTARYGFDYEWYNYGNDVFTGQPILNFDASIIDNQTGREIITFSAHYTKQNTCVDKLLKLVDENTK